MQEVLPICLLRPDHKAMLTGVELGRAIEAAIQQKGVTKKALAAHFGIQPPSIQDWVKRGTIDKEKLPRLWAFFSDTVGPEHWGLDRYPTGSPVELRSGETFPKGGVQDVGDFHRREGDRSREGTVSIPQLDVRASMGAGVMQPEHEEVIRTTRVSETWLRSHAKSFTSIDNLALLTGEGDSMAPTFTSGDALLVDRGVRDLRGKRDGIYVLARNDSLYVKRVQELTDGSILLISDNELYQTEKVDAQRDKFEVLGRVVMTWNLRWI